MPNFAPVKFMPGDHYDKRQDPYFNLPSTASNKCCICQAPIKVKSKKDDGVCPNQDCSRDEFFKEAHSILESGRWDKFLRSGN